MERRETGGRESEAAKRLRWLRLAERGDNAAAWAKKVGLSVTQLSNYENGIPISKNAAIQLANRVPGLTTDYLLRGKKDGMPLELRLRIEAVEAEESASGIKRQA